MTKLERKWWFVILVSMLATVTALYLTETAGLPRLADMSLVQGIVYFLCFSALWKTYSLAGWLLALCFGAGGAASVR
jgi:hypothetical protein